MSRAVAPAARRVGLVAAVAGVLLLAGALLLVGVATGVLGGSTGPAADPVGEPSDTRGAVAGLTDVRLVTTGPAVLAAGPQQVRLRVEGAAAGQEVFVGVARAADVEAWAGTLPRAEVRGPGPRAVVDGEPPVQGSLDVARTGGPDGPAAGWPDPRQADIWVASATGRGAAELTWTPAAGQWRAVLAAPAADGLGAVRVTWTRPADGSGAPLLLALGLALLLAGGAVAAVAARAGRRPPDPEWFDDRQSAGPLPQGRGRRRAGTPPWTPRLVATLAGPLLLVLAGCSDSPPRSAPTSPSTSPSTGPSGVPPVVLPQQAAAVLDRVDAVAAQVARSGRPGDFGARAAGPYRELLTAELTVRARTPAGGGPAGQPLTGLTRDRLLVTADVDWPRFFLVAGSAPGTATPVLRVLRSPSAREPYALWAQAELLPGATLPQVAPAVRGAPVQALDGGDGLVASPRQVATGYADVLTRGAGSPSNRLFAVDEFRRQVQQRLLADRRGVQGIGTVEGRHRVLPDGVLALRTADGGAVVVAALEQVVTVRLRPGAGAVTVDAALRALGGRDRYTTTMTRRSVAMLVLAVPPAGAGAVRVVAAAKGDLAVTGS